jgi:hypothetical protein
MSDDPGLFDEPAKPRKSVYDLYREECAQTARQFPPVMDGATFSEPEDGNRLRAQLAAVRAAMSDGEWHTLADLEKLTGAPQASVSARLRDLRKQKFGGHQIDRQRVEDGNGLHEYRMVLDSEVGEGD